jgi:hypothetical protein
MITVTLNNIQYNDSFRYWINGQPFILYFRDKGDSGLYGFGKHWLDGQPYTRLNRGNNFPAAMVGF